MPIKVSAPCDCSEACAKQVGCKAWTFSSLTFVTDDGRNCWLRSQDGGTVENCQGSCRSGHGDLCGTDGNNGGAELENMPIKVSAPCDCSEACAKQVGCKAWTFSSLTFVTDDGRNCWLRSQDGGTVENCEGSCRSGHGAYVNMGEGVCRIDGEDGKGYGHWGSGNAVDNAEAQQICDADGFCMAFWKHPAGGYQYFCSVATNVCDRGNSGVTNQPSDLRGSGTQGDTTCFIKSEQHYKAMMAWDSCNDFCVSDTSDDLPQTNWPSGDASLESCKTECAKKSNCSAVEWYVSGWDTSKCKLLLGDTKSTKCHTGSRWQDATCHFKPGSSGSGTTCETIDITCNGGETKNGENLGEGPGHAQGHSVGTVGECCDLCHATDGCEHYAFAKDSFGFEGICWLKDECVGSTKPCDNVSAWCGRV